MTTPETLDLHYLGRRGLISAFLATTGDGGFVLLDSGPASTIEALEREVARLDLRLDDLRAVMLTHIHLDHAAAAGRLSRRTGCSVWAHPVGIEHLARPEHKLLPSAFRLYGDQLEPLFGIVEGVPGHRLHAIGHGERVTLGSLEVVGWHAPGHAAHHVAWQVGAAVACGDVAGVRFGGSKHVVPPMPPPDIHVERWLESIALVRSLEPRRLLLTHFGSFDDPESHLDQLAARLRTWSDVTSEIVAGGGEAAELTGRLTELDDAEMEAAGVSDELRRIYRKIVPMAENAAGLHRYETKRRTQTS
jgi:glyoxylase-like metal-dependent hydrolase (beta-lactamase superfamily II)